MSKRLDVYLHASLVGTLGQDLHGQISFAYSAGWLQNTDAVPLSQSLPLRPEPFGGQECRGFFGGILPEEHNRELVARILGISARNDFAMLGEIGGECAGAVSFLPTGSKLPAGEPSYQPLTEADLSEILRELPQRPLMAGRRDVRLSLAGAQSKLSVHVDEVGISLPLHGAPSTHILKPANPRFENLVQNEAFCLKLAASAGLPSAAATIGSAGSIDYLLMARYDRERAPDGTLQRLHQEDFCQALALPSHLKYQNEGGPSLGQCFELLRGASTTPAPDLLNLLDAIVFNFLIGNHDAHGKNFSLLYSDLGGRQTTRLAPLYDLVSTAQYPDLSGKMAMKIGSKYIPADVELRHWESLWEGAGFSRSHARRRTIEFADKVAHRVSEMDRGDQIGSDIADRVHQRSQMILKSLARTPS